MRRNHLHVLPHIPRYEAINVSFPLSAKCCWPDKRVAVAFLYHWEELLPWLDCGALTGATELSLSALHGLLVCGCYFKHTVWVTQELLEVQVLISSWVNESSSFAETRCKVPLSLLNGKAIYENNTVGSTIAYFCERGYSLEGEPAAECTRDGRWSNPLPLCKRVCLLCNEKEVSTSKH